MYAFEAYLAYIAVTLAVIVWVGRTLRREGRVFLIDAFHGNEPMADSINRLLTVGFYLVNFGYAALALRSADDLNTIRGAIETMSVKIGSMLLILGILHFGNLYVLNRLRKHPRTYQATPALTPAAAPIGRILE